MGVFNGVIKGQNKTVTYMTSDGLKDTINLVITNVNETHICGLQEVCGGRKIERIIYGDYIISIQ